MGLPAGRAKPPSPPSFNRSGARARTAIFEGGETDRLQVVEEGRTPRFEILFQGRERLRRQ